LALHRTGAAFAFFRSESIGMSRQRADGSSFFSRSIDLEMSRVWGWASEHVALLLVGLGVLLRLVVYARDHPFCFDEQSLWGNIAGVRILEFSSELSADQLAPVGFLIGERALVALLGAKSLIGRLIPLLSGICALVLFVPLARKVLPGRAALVSLALFALSDDLIFYSCELKPYSVDLAVAVGLALATLHAIGRPITAGIGWGMALTAIASPWFSFPAVFIVAGCGLALVLTSLRSGRLRDVAVWCAVGAAWAVSFAAAYRASLAILNPKTSMYIFWNFAFLPIWPLPMDVFRIYQTIGILLEVFVNPLNMVHPLWVGVLLPLLVFLIGTDSQARRSWPAWVVFVVPILLAMFASSIRRYPFHGRLILELVPAFYLLIGVGAQRLGNGTAGLSRLGYKVFLVVLLGYPCSMGVHKVVVRPAVSTNQHGDLHDNLFLESDPTLPTRARQSQGPGSWAKERTFPQGL
jgi:hypothetical protein